jgi:ribonucleoside-diphosphate reductase alpha chain
MTFTYEEALRASGEYFGGDELAADVFVGKYALRDEEDNILERTPDDMHKRLAKEFARAESKHPNPLTEDQIYELFKNFKRAIPQGSPMSAIGNSAKLQSASNCFVIPSPYDSYGGILFTDQQQAQIMKRRGGVGFDLSTIRPRGLSTKNAAGTTDGIGVFMDRFSNTCREVAQGGRRGALMLSISCHHPEIRTFINIKRDKKKVTGANISVRWSDEFLQAVDRGEKVQLRFPVEKDAPHIVEEWVDAKSIWEEFVESAHASGEPGCLFWDTAIQRTPADCYPEFRSLSTNPCGEIILSPHDSCRLLAMNTLSYVRNPFKINAEFDFDEFAKDVMMSQRLMDDLVDLEIELVDKIIAKIIADPEPDFVKQIELDLWGKIKQAAINGRRTGIGVTAIGDTVAACNVRYGSSESIDLVERIYRTLAIAAYRASVELAKERGAFPAYDATKEVDHPFLEQIWKADPELARLHKKYGRRNIALSTTAPTGSVSTMTQTTSGIEPVFMLSYKRRKKINPNEQNGKVDFVDDLGDKWLEYNVYHHGVQKWIDATGETDLTKSPYFGSTANEIDWVAGVDVQAAAQKWICHAVSKTTNLPKTATKEDVHNVYWRGWKTGCKGITVYVDGSRSGVLVSSDDSAAGINIDKHGRPLEIQEVQAPKRPDALDCDIHQASVKGTRWTVFVGKLKDKPYEVFAGFSDQLSLPNKCKLGKIVKSKQGQYDAHVSLGDDEDLVIKNIVKVFDDPESAKITRLVSTSLRHGIGVEFLCTQLSKSSAGISEAPAVLSRILKKYIPDGKKASSGKCPECGSTNLVFQEGCLRCADCGNSKCG